MSFYYRTNWTDADKKPLIKVYLHQGEWYDHANKVVNEHGDSSTNHITHPNLIAYCQTTFAPSDDWKRFAGKFIQYGNRSENTDNIYSTIVRPQYILASFSTNENAGEGSTSDRLSIDDLWCIYDKGLASVSIGGTANSAALNTFNDAEYATHEPSRTYDDAGNPIFNNSGTATWTYPTPISCNNIPQISATPRSKLISQFTVMQAVPQNGYKATIYVKHNDNSEFYYYIQFTPALPNITLNNEGTYTACEGDDITVIGESDNIATLYSRLGGWEQPAQQTLREYMEENESMDSDLYSFPILVDKHSSLAGKTIRDCGLRRDYDCMVLGLQRNMLPIPTPDVHTIIAAGDSIWVLGTQEMADKLIEAEIVSRKAAKAKR